MGPMSKHYSQDAAGISEHLFDALEPLPLDERMSIPLSVFIETALESGVPVAEVIALTRDAAEHYAKMMRSDGLSVAPDKEPS